MFDEKMKRLEKRIASMERETNRNFQRVEDAFSTFRDALLKMQHENSELRKDRDFLLNAYRMELKKIPVPSLKADIRKMVVSNMGGKIKSNFELVRNVASETLEESRIDELFELVFLNSPVKSRDASRKLNVHEKQIEEWAKKLEAMELIEMRNFKGQTVLHKRT